MPLRPTHWRPPQAAAYHREAMWGPSALGEAFCRTVAKHAQDIALVDGENATVKKFYREPGGRVRLQPANPSLQAMYYQADRVVVQGIVVGVIRKY